MRLNTIKPGEGSKHAKRRVGRGIGSGLDITGMVEQLVASGRYQNASEVLREGLDRAIGSRSRRGAS